jgi:hypothetical protein
VGTCQSPAPIPCRQCSGGCGCPKGTVMYKKACLKPEECPYCKQWTTFINGCKHCICWNHRFYCYYSCRG